VTLAESGNVLAERGRLAWYSSIVIAGTLLGNASGFLREAAVAAFFGATRAADMYVVAFTLPEFLWSAMRNILPGVALPILAAIALVDGGHLRWRVATALFSVIGMSLALLSAVAILTGRLWMPWLAPGFSPGEQALALRMGRLMFVWVVVGGLASLLAAYLNSLEHFVFPALITVAYNTIFLAVLFLFHRQMGVFVLAWAVALGGVAQLLIQLPGLWRLRAWHKQWSFWRPEVRGLLPFGGYFLLGYTLHYFGIAVTRALASDLAVGAVAMLNYATMLGGIITMIAGFSLGTAAFPRLAVAARGGWQDLSPVITTVLHWSWFLGLPMALGAFVLSLPLVQIVYGRGVFDHASVLHTARLLRFLLVAVLADGISQPMWFVLYSHQHGKALLAINALVTAARITFALALIPSLSYFGLALATSLAFVGQVFLLAYVVLPGRENWRRALFHGYWWRVAAAGVMLLPFAWGGNVLAGRFGALPALSAGALMGGAAYFAAGWLLNVPEARVLPKLMGRFL